jgi:hypothetical protein
MRLKQLLIGTALIAISLQLSGCGKSDPVPAEFQTDIPRGTGKVTPQNFEGVMLDLRVEDSATDSRELDFFEGQSRDVKIRARIFVDGAQFTLVPRNFPAGAQLLKGNQSDLWLIRWKPASGLIPAAANKTSFQAQIEFVLDDSSSAQTKALFEQDKRNRIKSFGFNVHLPTAQPVLTLVGLDREFLKMTDVIPFRIEIVDPASSKTSKPDALIVPIDRENESAEIKTFPLSIAVIHDPSKNDQFLGGGKWVFYRILDMTVVPEKYLGPKTGNIAGAFKVFAYNSATRLESIPKLERFTIQRKE